MPLLSPNQIQNVLKEVVKRDAKTEESLESLLEESSLGKREVLDTLGSLMRGADTSAVRLQSAKTALQLHGMMNNDEAANVPTINIIIRDSEFSFNPILVPRS